MSDFDPADFVDDDFQARKTQSASGPAPGQASRAPTREEVDSRVTDTGLSYLVTFPELECLDLQGSSEITDQGLLELRLLRGLRWLDLRGCRRLTETGMAALRAALPRCEIVA